jgi:hypothetical protein
MRRVALPRFAAAFFAALSVWCATSVSFGATPVEPMSGPAAPTAVSNLADPPRVDIEWEAPAECPDLRAVRRRAERLLGQPLNTPRAQQLLARAQVHRNEAGNWELRLSLTGNQSVAEETLIAKQCSALADATALKVALAIDPVATARAIEVVALAPEPQPKLVARPSDVVQQSAPSQAPFAAGGVRVAGGGGFGLLPGVARGAALSLWVERSQWRVELAGQGYFGGDARYQQMPTVGASLNLFSGLARVCPVARASGLEFPLCVGLELGFMRGVGFGLEIPEKSNSWWGAVVLGPAFRLPVSEAVALWFEADGVAPFLRPGFNVRNLGTLYTAAPGSARLWVGCEIRLSR